MRLAIGEAQSARRNFEVPVGAVIIDGDQQLIASGHNLTESSNDPTAHAEIIAIREAARRTGSWRLNGCTLYVTLEPCAMCAGAIVNSRIERLVFGARDSKAGAVSSLYNIGTDGKLNHKIITVADVLSDECSGIMRDFFRMLRKEQV